LLLRARLQELAVAHHRRRGYRMLTALLRREGHLVNHKRALRLMREDNLLSLRRQKKRARASSSRRWVLPRGLGHLATARTCYSMPRFRNSNGTPQAPAGWVQDRSSPGDFSHNQPDPLLPGSRSRFELEAASLLCTQVTNLRLNHKSAPKIWPKDSQECSTPPYTSVRQWPTYPAC
jgi:hypothetical protein